VIAVRAERAQDFGAIEEMVKRCYRDVAYSNHREHRMIARLRASAAYVPQLALVAELDGELAGHVMLTRIVIRGEAGDYPSLALAPLSVAPAFQGRGVGAALVEAVHAQARGMGFHSVIIAGIAGYYQSFGYAPLDTWPIRLPFAVHPDHRMAVALTPGGLDGVAGLVEYAPEWLSP
jgi:predicted N-acetyltransferase YhbS